MLTATYAEERTGPEHSEQNVRQLTADLEKLLSHVGAHVTSRSGLGVSIALNICSAHGYEFNMRGGSRCGYVLRRTA